MSLAIRLSRIGRKGEARFRVVVQEKRWKPSGYSIETLGTLIRRVGKAEKKIDQDRLNYWISKAAQLSGSLKKVLTEN